MPYPEYAWGDTKQDQDVVLVGTASQSEDYDWNEFRVYRNTKTGQLYWGSSAGCSCNDFESDFQSVDDLTTGSVQEAHEALDAYVADAGSWGNNDGMPAQVADLHLTLSQLPSAS